MGATDATFFWYPEAAGSLEELDLGEPVSDVQGYAPYVVYDARNGVGTRSRSIGFANPTVTISLERFSSAPIRRDLMGMIDHLRRGGYVGFSADKAKAYCTWMGAVLIRSGTIVYGGGNLFNAWNPSAALVSGDEVVIETPNPAYRRQESSVQSVAGTQITLTRGSLYEHVGCFLRHRYFFPMLRLPEEGVGAELLTDEHGLNNTLDLTLELDLNAIGAYLQQSSYQFGPLALASAAVSAQSASGRGSSGLYTLEGMLAAQGRGASASFARGQDTLRNSR